MTAIWENSGEGWRVANPAGFAAEAALHDLVERSPELMPLAGGPSLAIVGREVRLGTGYADLVGIEASGRPVIIEVKLAYNSEARRSVVAQILTYAAYMFGLDVATLERDVLGRHLHQRGFSSVFEAASATDQVNAIDRQVFYDVLERSLRSGEFRLVIVLDDAPPELQDLVGYLEAVTDRLTVDLVAVRRFEIGGSTILVPQRVEPERRSEEAGRSPVSVRVDGYLVEGADDFEQRIASSPESEQPLLRRLVTWARRLEADGLVHLATYHGKGDERLTLLPRLPAEKAGLVTIWNDAGSAYIQFWRSVFERASPRALERVNAILQPREVGQGTTAREIDEQLLEELAAAYREAASIP